MRTPTTLISFRWLLALLATVAAHGDEVIYPGYRWSTLGDGLYLHSPISPLAGPVDSNSVVIVTGDGVWVVDTHINPAVSRAVIAQIQRVTEQPVTHVVNTHWHDDHTNGNHAYRQAFPDAKIIAHKSTLAAMRREWPAMIAQRQQAYAPLEADQILAAADKLDDAEAALGYRIYAGYVAALKPELPELQLVYPDTLVEDRLEVQYGNRRIIVEWLGRGNTHGDVVVWLPDDGVLITGDLLVAPIPYAFDSPMADWIETLERLAATGARTLVPGHGAVQRDNQYLERVMSLLRATVTGVRKARQSGIPFSELSGAVDLSSHEQGFVGGDPERAYAWRTYYLAPGLKSAWTSLGFPVPDPQ
ncbi:MAG: MBL fold metallo-hydrolase [Xanthomonadales bacterium]|nr:MBL fold metallo-hydrolase [Xanthomonadales bacterium]